MPINRLSLKKILSFNDTTVELGPLNVLIGPNAVGKSNLIEVIGLLQAAPTNLGAAILRGGPVRQWFWLGDANHTPAAEIDCELELTNGRQYGPLAYHLSISADSGGGFAIASEQLSTIADIRGKLPPTFFSRVASSVDLQPKMGAVERRKKKLGPVSIHQAESVLARLKNPADPTPVTAVGNFFEAIRIFREFRTGTGAGARYGAAISGANDSLRDGGDNLALVLNKLDILDLHGQIRSYLRRFCERFEDVKIDLGEGIARLLLRESGLAQPLAATRVSDGTLKFLSLLAVLFHPAAPTVLCIEEPELGLHPDALQLVGEALIEASGRTQLIVTTHSDALVDAMSGTPDTVLVCERGFDGGTAMKRLSGERLRRWLEHYSLGQLWRSGELGGGRW